MSITVTRTDKGRTYRLGEDTQRAIAAAAAALETLEEVQTEGAVQIAGATAQAQAAADSAALVRAL